jgi:hypothetical protein
VLATLVAAIKVPSHDKGKPPAQMQIDAAFSLYQKGSISLPESEKAQRISNTTGGILSI